jgi:uncharacterized protein
MSREFPDLLNPWKAADGRRTFEGTMPLRRMQRLLPLLAPRQDEQGASSSTGRTEGSTIAWKDAWFRADFAHDGQGNVTIELWVEAELPLICQRSLQPYLEPVKRHSLLAVVESFEEQEQLPEHYEPVMAEQSQVAMLDLVEDELLLALPQVPRAPDVPERYVSTDGESDRAADEPNEPTRRPFEGLAGLLKKRAED